MNEYEFVQKLLARRTDLQLIIEDPCNQPMGIEIATDDARWDKSAFDHCSEPELKTLLEAFLVGRLPNLGFSVQIELSVALCLHGRLVSEIAEPLLISKCSGKNIPQVDYLLWAYFGSHIKYEPFCIKLIANSQEDFRDGIFIACYNLNTRPLYCLLVKSFMKWLDSPHWGNGSGELDSLKMFLDKWDQTMGFTEHDKLRERFFYRASSDS